MRRYNTPNGYVVSLPGMHSAFTAQGVLIGRYSLKRDALAAKPDTIADLRLALVTQLTDGKFDIQTVQRINAWDDATIIEWAGMLTAA